MFQIDFGDSGVAEIDFGDAAGAEGGGDAAGGGIDWGALAEGDAAADGIDWGIGEVSLSYQYFFSFICSFSTSIYLRIGKNLRLPLALFVLFCFETDVDFSFMRLLVNVP